MQDYFAPTIKEEEINYLQFVTYAFIAGWLILLFIKYLNKYLRQTKDSQEYVKLKGHSNIIAQINDAYILCTDPLGMLGLFQRLVEEYGKKNMDPVGFYLAGEQSYFVCHPEGVSQALSDKTVARIPWAISRMRESLGYNIITAPSRDRKKIRGRVHSHLNSRHYFASISRTMYEVANEVVLPNWKKHCKAASKLNIFDGMLAYASTVAFAAFLGVPIGDLKDIDIHHKLNNMFGCVRERTFAAVALPLFFPTKANRYFKQTRSSVVNFITPYLAKNVSADTMAGSIIRAHTTVTNLSKQNLQDLQSFITKKLTEFNIVKCKINFSEILHLISTTPAKVTAITNKIMQQLNSNIRAKKFQDANKVRSKLAAAIGGELCKFGKRDNKKTMEEVVSMIIAGSETTIVLMTWCWYYLAQFPDFQERIYQEAKELKDFNPENAKNTLSKLPFLKNVINETLRLRGPASTNGRKVTSDFELNLPGNRKALIPKGSNLFFSAFITQQSEQLWSEPTRFNPDRYNKPSEKIKVGNNYYPFGYGQYRCIGERYAIYEAALGILIPIMNGYQVTLSDPDLANKMPLVASLTLRPGKEIKLQVTRPREIINLTTNKQQNMKMAVKREGKGKQRIKLGM